MARRNKNVKRGSLDFVYRVQYDVLVIRFKNILVQTSGIIIEIVVQQFCKQK